MSKKLSVPVFLCACLGILAAFPSWGGILYVAHGGGSVGAAQGGVIGTIDQATFTYTPLTGSLGSLSGLIYDGASLWAYNTQADQFLQVDPVSGAVISTVSRSGGSDPTDLAYNPVTGGVYAVDTSYGLYTVNLVTGAMTLVGPAPNSVGGYLSLAFTPGGVLYAHNTNSPGEFYIIDPATGGILSTIQGGVPGGALGLAFDPATGNLIVSECCGGSDGALGERLFSLDPATGVATLLYDYDDGRRMQDFAIGAISEIPEPGTMATMALALATLALARRRKRG